MRSLFCVPSTLLSIFAHSLSLSALFALLSKDRNLLWFAKQQQGMLNEQ